jgi:hypothetical protein
VLFSFSFFPQPNQPINQSIALNVIQSPPSQTETFLIISLGKKIVEMVDTQLALHMEEDRYITRVTFLKGKKRKQEERILVIGTFRIYIFKNGKVKLPYIYAHLSPFFH